MNSVAVSGWKALHHNRILALFVPLALVSIAAARTPERRTHQSAPSYVNITAHGSERSPSPANPPIVQGVKYLVRNALEAAKPGSSKAACVRNALVPVFGSKMTESTADVVYRWYWDGHKYIWVCSSLTIFEVEVEGLGSASIEVLDSQV